MKIGGAIEVPHQLGYGCMSLSSNIYIPTPVNYSDKEGIRIIHRALELGITHFDSASLYGWGHNEELLGKAIAHLTPEQRSTLCIATKAGFDGSFTNINNSREYLIKTCIDSCSKLGTYIDLFYIHRIDPRVPIEDTMKVMKELVQAGYIRHVGLSEASGNTIRRAHAVYPVTAVQLEWSLWSRDVEAEVIPTCRSLGIGIVPYSPLGRGVLTGTVNNVKTALLKDYHDGDFRKHMFNRTIDGALEHNLKMVEKLKQMAHRKGFTAAQLALAWVLSQGDDVFPIPGTSQIRNLESNMEALRCRLTTNEMQELNEMFPAENIQGTRYPAGMATFKDN